MVLWSILLTALHTRLRRGELFALTWPDLDMKAKVIRVVHTKNGKRRAIPMTPTLWETLQHVPRKLGSEIVFAGKTGNGLIDIRQQFTRALRQAGIADGTLHTGHKRIKMTLRYVHLAPDHKRAAVHRLDTSMDTRAQEQGTEMAVPS